MSLTGHRSPRWVVELLDGRDAPIRVLTHVTGGSVVVAPFERLGGSATLVLDQAQPIDWLSHRVRITYDPGVAGVDAWPVGTYLLTSPKRTVDEYGVTKYDVGLLSKLVVPDEHALEQAFTVQAGDPLIPAAVSLLAMTGETRMSVTDTGIVARETLTWDAGESVLTAINAILQAAGYWSLQVSGDGQYLFEPYVDPADREPAWTFQAGCASIIKPGLEHEQDLAGIPNHVVCHTQGSEDEPALVGVATNTSKDSPYSTVSRGRTISRTYQVEAATQKVVDDLALRRLQDAMSPISHWTFSHGIAPIDGHDVLLFPDGNQEVRASVQRIEMSLEYDSQAKTIVRQGVDLGDQD